MADFEQNVDDALVEDNTIKGNVNIFMVRNKEVPDKALDEIRKMHPHRERCPGFRNPLNSSTRTLLTIILAPFRINSAISFSWS